MAVTAGEIVAVVEETVVVVETVVVAETVITEAVAEASVAEEIVKVQDKKSEDVTAEKNQIQKTTERPGKRSGNQRIFRGFWQLCH